MRTLRRINKLGLEYHLIEHPEDENMVLVKTGEKMLLMETNIENLNQGWYYWQNGQSIQTAFPFLSNEEREFLMTGITPTEWNEIFSKEEE